MGPGPGLDPGPGQSHRVYKEEPAPVGDPVSISLPSSSYPYRPLFSIPLRPVFLFSLPLHTSNVDISGLPSKRPSCISFATLPTGEH